MNMKAIVTGVVALLFSHAAMAIPLTDPRLGLQIISGGGGDIIATFLGHTAAYSNDLYLEVNVGSDVFIFNNHLTPVGTTFNLGTFAAGVELIFRLHVNNTGEDFYSGPGSRNPDQLPHALVEELSPGLVYVGFEDLFGGGDLDFDDLQYSFTNVVASVPAGPALPLLGLGMVLLGLVRRRAL